MPGQIIEMTEEEARVLRGSQALLDQLLKSKDTKRDTEKLIKKLHPNTVTTDDIAAPYIERLDGMEKKLDGFLKRVDDDKVDTKFNADLDWLRSSEGGNYTDDGIEKIKQVMVKESIPNARAAAAWWEKLNPPKPQEPSTYSPQDWGFGRKTEDVDEKLLFEDPDGWAEREAHRVFAESRKNGQIIT